MLSITNSDLKLNADMDQNPSFDDGNPLVFQSTLSSLSREYATSDSGEESNHANKLSIFRPRNEDAIPHVTQQHRQEPMPNLVSHSCLDENNYEGRSQMQSNVQNDDTYPTEVVLDPRDEIDVDMPILDFDSNDSVAKPAVQNESSDSYLKKRKYGSLVHSESSDYYKVLYSFRQAFTDFSFLLPGLKEQIFDMLQDSSQNNNGNMKLSPTEVTFAKRRLSSAVCAFGGCKKETKSQHVSYNSPFNNNQAQLLYEQQLSSRFYMNETRLSWDVEEAPPVECSRNEITQINRDRTFDSTTSKQESTILVDEDFQKDDPNDKGDGHSEHGGESGERSGESTKAKYRCKLCGQPKQNHTCPFLQSLQRSIGTMSYPALNAYESSEPGVLSTSLIEMNNFFDNYDENDLEDSNDTTHTDMNVFETKPIHNVASESQKPQTHHESSNFINDLQSKKRRIAIQPSFVLNEKDKFSKDSLLLPKIEMKPEQYRVVSANQSFSQQGSYSYPPIPLTYLQRQSMSDSLFNLSKTRFGLMDECSKVLEEAQRMDSWDQAVAELITQVAVVLHCTNGDHRLEGLRQYLLTYGISC